MNILDKIESTASSQNDWTKRDFEAGQAAARALSKALNGGTNTTIMLGFLEGLVREHRFLQSQVIWTVLTALAELGGPELGHRTDARNEHAIKACREIRQLLADRLPLA